MNKRGLARFRRWFVANAPPDLDFGDPESVLRAVNAADAKHRNARWCVTEVDRFMYDLVCEFEARHIGVHELGPVLVEAAVAVTLRS